MVLSILERLIVLHLLPKEGSFANLKLLRVAKESLSFNEEENKALNFRQEGEQIKWDNVVVTDKEIEVGEVVTQMIVKELKKMDGEGKLIEEHVGVYEKFIK